MTSTARQLRQPPTIEAIKRVPYFADVGNKRVAFPEKETTLSNIVVALPGSPLGNLFFSDSSLLMLPNLFSSNTPIPFP